MRFYVKCLSWLVLNHSPVTTVEHTLHLLCVLLLPLPGSPRLPVASAHVTPLRRGSQVGGHGDVFSGGLQWTVTGPLFDLPDLLVILLFLH
jgi:hypothetical protein